MEASCPVVASLAASALIVCFVSDAHSYLHILVVGFPFGYEAVRVAYPMPEPWNCVLTPDPEIALQTLMSRNCLFVHARRVQDNPTHSFGSKKVMMVHCSQTGHAMNHKLSHIFLTSVYSELPRSSFSIPFIIGQLLFIMERWNAIA